MNNFMFLAFQTGKIRICFVSVFMNPRYGILRNTGSEESAKSCSLAQNMILIGRFIFQVSPTYSSQCR